MTPNTNEKRITMLKANESADQGLPVAGTATDSLVKAKHLDGSPANLQSEGISAVDARRIAEDAIATRQGMWARVTLAEIRAAIRGAAEEGDLSQRIDTYALTHPDVNWALVLQSLRASGFVAEVFPDASGIQVAW